MSAISTAYDEVVAGVASVLTSHVRISNPYALDQNPEPFLALGYGVGIGTSENTNRQLGRQISIRRTFNVVITRKFYAKETDVSSKATVEKQLMEDQLLVINYFISNSSLPSGSVVSFTGDSGIQQVFGEKDNFLSLESNFTVEVFETVS